MATLPVDTVLPQLLQALADSPGAVLQAPPGSGKTSRVPLALLNAPFLQGKSLVMLEPRRLAAVNAATWLARSVGEPVGATVGYSIRFQRQVSKATRLEVVTEGLLTRRLQTDPGLDGVGLVIFDEFHERSLQADTALAFCLDVQRHLRDDLKILVMSATLESGPVSHLLGDVPVVSCEGRMFPVDVRYLGEQAGDIAQAAARGVHRVLRETAGDILVFLPGSGEIRRCQEQLRQSLTTGAEEVVPLYGDLPFAEQERAIVPTRQRKVVLATAIAETSLTIEGVTVVIDAGLSRRLQYDPNTGLNRLVTVRVSAASAIQRAGRAGRLGPGACYRLWSEGTQSSLVPYNPPEIRIADLAPLALDLANWGTTDACSLSWLDPPPIGAMNEANILLRELGALDENRRITPLGRRMAGLPLHPRLARLVLDGERGGCAAVAYDLAALIEERDIFRRDRQAVRPVSDCDFTDRLEALHEWRKRGGHSNAIVDPSACRAVDRAADRLRQLMRVPDQAAMPVHDQVVLLLAQAWPDRIARQREPGSDRYLLAQGTGARLGQRSAVRDQPFIVAVEMSGSQGAEAVIHGASALTLDALRQKFGETIVRERSYGFDAGQGRVWAREDELFNRLVLTSRPVPPSDEELFATWLAEIGREDGLVLLPWSQSARQFQARVVLLHRVCPEEPWPDLGDDWLAVHLEEWLPPWLAGVRTLADLQRLDLHAILKGLLPWDLQRRLDEGVPTHIAVPSGSRIAIDYVGDAPVLAVKLQELFGLAETPTVAWGRVPLLLHLLSPARRPIQVTGDLRSFWNTTYPEVKKELKGRYPRHPWPDDPWLAVPMRGTKKREGR
jgi:ATP-dependent helicase HrpB